MFLKKQKLIKISKYILDIIFPIRCIGCNQEDNFICSDCFNKIEICKKQKCPKCLTDSEDGSFCSKCKISSKMKGIIVSASYENKILQKAIHNLKYKFIKDLSADLAKLLAASLKTWMKYNGKDINNIILIPVPLHKKREKSRGFNQSELLADNLMRRIKLPINKNLIFRKSCTASQANLDHWQRRKNIKNAFQINKNSKNILLTGKIIIIIDDVCTTSSTLEECAKILDKFNPKEIWGLVLARGK